MCKAIGYDSFSELPGFLLGTSWTVRIAMLRIERKNKSLTKKELRAKKKKKRRGQPGSAH
jgi:hypothetical protein